MQKHFLFLLIGCISLMSLPTTAQEAQSILVHPLKNDAGLGDAEITVLNRTIFAALSKITSEKIHLNRATDAENEHVNPTAEATWIVTGEITPFGNGYVTSLHLTAASSFTENTTVCSSLEILLSKTKKLALQIADRIQPGVIPAAVAPIPLQPSPTKTNSPTTSSAAPPHSIVPLLKVEAIPADANIFLSEYPNKQGDLIGQGTVQKQLAPGTYYITCTKNQYESKRKTVRLDIGETKSLKIGLPFIIPASPYKTWGHISFWTGVAMLPVGILGMIFAKDTADYYAANGRTSDKTRTRKLTGMMWVGYGGSLALMGTGILLWLLNPGDRAYYEQKNGPIAALSSDGSGISFSYKGSF